MSLYSYLFKLIIVGDSSVGKSCILVRFMKDQFNNNYSSTVGVQFGSRTIDLNDKKIKLQIWDTAGQETFRSITRSYYRGAIGVVLVYDITRRQSFDNVLKWLQDIGVYGTGQSTIMLVGNKNDLQQKRSVQFQQATALSQKYNNMFNIQVSAKTGQGVDEIFNQLSLKILQRILSKQLDSTKQSLGFKVGALQCEDEVFKSKDKKKCCKS